MTQPSYPPVVSAQHFAFNYDVGSLSLSFGTRRMGFYPDSDAINVVEWVTTANMSPVHAKLLRDLLDSAINRYEAQFGEIIAPPAALADENGKRVDESGQPLGNIEPLRFSAKAPLVRRFLRREDAPPRGETDPPGPV